MQTLFEFKTHKTHLVHKISVSNACMCIPVTVRHKCSDRALMCFAEEVEIHSGVVKNMLMNKIFAPTTSMHKLLSTDIFIN